MQLIGYIQGDCSPSYTLIQSQIEPSKTVLELRDNIGNQCGEGINTRFLRVWKLNCPIPENGRIDDTLTTAASDLPNFATAPKPLDRVGSIFGQPPDCHVHIIVERTSNLGTKRKNENNDSGLHPKRQFTCADRASGCSSVITHPSEEHLAALDERLRTLEDDPEYYSNPANFFQLTFPNFCPPKQFSLSDEHQFSYMGRMAFAEVWRYIDSFEFECNSRLDRLFILGSQGAGVSHILAAVACLLYRLEKTVVYLPDAARMLKDPLEYIKCALLCAFARPGDVYHYYDLIRRIQSRKDLEDFCWLMRPMHMYIIVDGMEAIWPDEFDDGEAPPEERVNSMLTLLRTLHHGHYAITAASANRRTMEMAGRRQVALATVKLWGGMTENEMGHWWTHHHTDLPDLNPEDRGKIEQFTGRLPLLLRPLLDIGSPATRSFKDVELAFWEHPDFLTVKSNVLGFGRKAVMKCRTAEFADQACYDVVCVSSSAYIRL
ncbi:hypothetical protein BV22DRAFT_1037685 [Leucogyrophana mollusca]|uniref:Uncharacterized protein n=1 Tax=Leucogyrophana mollusca TaxID=85980 RepID=A0ACB8B9Z2_9AGAM|nr:hypothetical protein BV22DRAFT_1037685 [Leucogyrophana mollusca]